MPAIDGYRIGIVGALTIVGKELVTILRDRVFPLTRLALLTDDEEEVGTLADGVVEPVFLKATSREELQDLDYVFFCGDPSDIANWIAFRRELGFVAIDLTQPSAFANEEPPRVAGIVSEEDAEDGLIISAHPIATMICLILDPLMQLGKIDHFSASVLVPASESGQEGIDELFQQTLAVLNAEGPPREVFEQQMAFNVYSPSGAADLERFVLRQIREICGTDLEGSLLVQQGATFHSHALALHVEMAEPLDDSVVRRALEAGESVGFGDPDTFPGITDAGGIDEILIVRLHQDHHRPRSLWIQAASDNLRRSSALNAVMLVEEILGRSGAGPN